MNTLLHDQLEWAAREAHRHQVPEYDSPLRALLALPLLDKLALMAGGVLFAIVLFGLPWVLAMVVVLMGVKPA